LKASGGFPSRVEMELRSGAGREIVEQCERSFGMAWKPARAGERVLAQSDFRGR
jgi:hypothetical protein